MTRFHATALTPLLACLALAACCPPVLLAPEAIRCDADAKLLAAKCDLPTPIGEGATYQTLVDAMQKDRQSLRECAIATNALRDSINRCNAATDAYNAKIREINAQNKH